MIQYAARKGGGRMNLGMIRGVSIVAQLGLLLMLGASMSACAGLFGHSKEWKEEVKLYDGRVIVVERLFHLGGYPGLEARERSPLDQTITFTLPGSNKRISWATEYRDDKPEANSLGPLLLDVVDGIPYLVTSPAGCIAYNKWGRPNPPYVLFKYINDQWQQIPLQELPPQLIEANLIGLPQSSQLQSYYTVEAASAERNRGNVSAYAKTILREAVKSGDSVVACPDFNSKRMRSFSAPFQ